MSKPSTLTIAALREELGLTLDGFGAAIGLRSKGQVSEIERSGRSSPEVALRIERLSAGRISASRLNDTIAAARASAPQEAA